MGRNINKSVSRYKKIFKVTSSKNIFFNALNRLICEVVACINDPSATIELQKLYKARQFYAVVSQMPLSSVGNMLASLIVFIIFWPTANHTLLVVWISCLWGIGLANLVLWWKCRKYDENKPLKKFTAELLVLDLAVAAILHAGMAIYLFSYADEQGRLLITAILAAFISTGSWMFSFLPFAGLAWIFVFITGIIVSLPHVYEGNNVVSITLVSFFGLVLAATVLVCSRMFLSNLKAETEIENQRQVMGLLLNDFEENASDWLWETDSKGNLQHASVRLAQILGTSEAEIEGKSFFSIIASLCKNEAKDECKSLELLDNKLAQLKPFKDVLIPVTLDKKKRWWSITAKPLIDRNDQFKGWRGVGSDITDATLREQEMVHLANFDTLTNLANRHHFNHFLEQLFLNKQANSLCTMFLIDLDNFKMVNDSLGHSVGDKLLKEVGARLNSILIADEMLARLGGDEFVIVYCGEMDRKKATAYSEQILTILNKPWEVLEHRIEVFASVGIASAPTDAKTGQGLFRSCDMALYAAKAKGKASFCFYEEDMKERAKDKLALMSDMKKGLQNNQFLLHYQPQIDLKSGDISGFEALLRWQHPTKGMISPFEFIPLAEESGFINILGEFVLNQACKDAKNWPEHLRIAVNVSAIQFQHSDIFKIVTDVITQHQLAPERLEIELTESAMITDTENVLSTLNHLREIGVRIALDDFGTGYSSLAYLQQIPIDKLKIDRSFVLQLDTPENERALAVLQCIIGLAKAFNFETTVEGVEELHHTDIFKKLECSYAQGYYYSKPIDAISTLSFIKASD